jgi:hypothetical protein
MIFSETLPEQKNKFHTRIDQFPFSVDVAMNGKHFRKIPLHLLISSQQRRVVAGILTKCLPYYAIFENTEVSSQQQLL